MPPLFYSYNSIVLRFLIIFVLAQIWKILKKKRIFVTIKMLSFLPHGNGMYADPVGTKYL